MIKKLLITYLFLITNVFAGLPPTTMRGQSQTLKPTTFNFQVPNKQATITAASTSLIETGNNNELENRGFEHTTVTTGWTISSATPSSSTTRIEGSKSLSLALTGALSLSQSSTINAAQKSGVQMVASIWVNSSDVSDLQLCSLKNGSEDKCTVTGGYVQGSGWRQLTVSFLGDSTSNGLKLKSTDITGTVLVDQAYVGIGSPVVDFTPDMVYSAYVSSSGAVSKENTDWINGNCSVATNRFTCNFVTSLVTQPLNCVITSGDNLGGGRLASVVSISSTQLIYDTVNDAAQAFAYGSHIVCQKQGADYKTSKAYVASGSLALNTTVYSAKVSATGVVSGENTDWINGNGSISDTSLFTMTLSAGVFTNAPNCSVVASDAGASAQYTARISSISSTQLAVRTGSSTTGSSFTKEALNFEVICQKQGADYQAAFNPVIVGSFEGIEKCANAYECTSEFTAYISTTGVVTNENIDWINGNCTNPTGTQRSCTYNTNLKDGVSPLSSPMNCTASAKTGTGYTSSAFVLAPTSTGFIFNSGYGTNGELQDIIVHCQKGTNDYKPKTAKIASSIGVPTVPGVTTQAIDTFSVSYGTTNATTACSASPCSYLDQIGSAVTSVTRSGTGSYSINTAKTYTKLKCNINSSSPSGTGVSSGVRCENCSSITFYTTNVNVAGVPFFDTYGTLQCQGSY